MSELNYAAKQEGRTPNCSIVRFKTSISSVTPSMLGGATVPARDSVGELSPELASDI